ncbi:MAG: tRNA pseudouridine(38-40) synthase TruA [Leptospiraceae bacterium]|nr:tRNA pseudouridine(38-40) synthase TruA [Leptospiraceae bacterium]
MPVIACILEYDGSYFRGFQRQKDLLTVQSTLEEAIKVSTGEIVKITAAGRTDTGVHAKGMVISFPLQNIPKNLKKFNLSLNALSHQGVSVLALREMPEEFNARFSCTEREYEFLILNSKFESPLYEKKAYRVYKNIDLELIDSQINGLIGKYDFKSFAKSTSVKGVSTERQITSIQFKPSLDTKGLYRLMIRGTGFLHNMIRIIVGTIFDVASGKIQMDLKSILEAGDRTIAGKTLPPHGLYFNKAYYRDYPEIEKMYYSNIPTI